MKKLFVVIMVFCSLVFLPSVNAQFLSPTASVSGDIEFDANMFFSGKTTITGDLQGYPSDNPFYNETFEISEEIPITIPDELLHSVENITRHETIDIYPILSNGSTINNLREILVIHTDTYAFESYTNATVTTDNKPLFLATINGSASIDPVDFNYAVSTVLNFEIEDKDVTFFVSIADEQELPVHYTGELSVLKQFPTSNAPPQITIQSKENNASYNVTDNLLFIINDQQFTHQQSSSLNLLPIAYQGSALNFSFSITPADPQYFDLMSLLNNFTQLLPEVIPTDTPDLSPITEQFAPIISGLSPMINGAMVIVEDEGTLTIDDSEQSFQNFAIGRGEKVNVVLKNDGTQQHTASVQGQYKLVFLGDHLYTTQATESDAGIAIPIIIIALWVLAVGIYIAIRFLFKPEIDEERDQQIKQYGWIIHLVLLIVAFILLDMEINYQIGVSIFGGIGSLLTGGGSLSLIAFAIIASLQLGVWGLGFLSFGLPTRIATNQVLRVFGIEKGGKGIGKGVGALSIWVFAALYLKLVVNLVLWILKTQGMNFSFG